MSRTEVDRSPVHSRVGPQRGRLKDAVDAFRAATTATGGTRWDWCAGVGTALAGLRGAWQEHVQFTEAPNGLFDELLDEPVEVTPAIDHLRRDHTVVAGAMTRVGSLLRAPEAGPDDEKLVLALANVAKLVDQHRRRGAELLYRVYSVDLAGGG